MSLANDFLRSLAVKPEVLILLGDSDRNVVSIPCQINFFHPSQRPQKINKYREITRWWKHPLSRTSGWRKACTQTLITRLQYRKQPKATDSVQTSLSCTSDDCVRLKINTDSSLTDGGGKRGRERGGEESRETRQYHIPFCTVSYLPCLPILHTAIILGRCFTTVKRNSCSTAFATKSL